jgi:Tol biopolymer transport system component
MPSVTRSSPGILLAAAGLAACGCGSSRQATTEQPAPTATTAAPGNAGYVADPFSDAAYPVNGNTALDVYQQVFAGAITVETTGPEARSGGMNQSQVSFALEGADFDPDVSRDGHFVVFASTQHRATPDIYLKTVGRRVVTQLTNDPAQDVMPKLSPDGSRIAFASDRNGNWDIFVMPATGGKAVQVTSSTSDELHPSWSPDGASLVFSRKGDVSDRWEIWITHAQNTGIADFIGYGLFPSWCPVAGTGAAGADKILFQKGRERGERTYGVWTIDYRDGQADNLTEIISSPVAACINPTWSPDGQWIAFATVPNPGEWTMAPGNRPPVADLWMVGLDGDSRINLTAGRFCNLMPAWGPGNRLFFVSDRSGTDNIWSLDAGAAIKLASAPAGAGDGMASGGEPRPAHGVANVPAMDPGHDH